MNLIDLCLSIILVNLSSMRNYNDYNIKDIVEFASINSSNIHYINVTEDNEKTNWVKKR